MRKQINFYSLIAILTLLTLSSCERNEVTKLTLDESTKTLTLGQIDSLYADTQYDGNIVPSIIWTSSNSKVVTVKNGQVEAIKKGNAVITATAGDKTAICTITVEDEITPTFTKGELIYYGDAYETAKSNNFTIILASADKDLSNLNSNVGEFMYIEFNTPLTVTDSIPSGTYNIDETLNSGTLVPGYIDKTNVPWGTWYFGKSYNDIATGTAVVKLTKNVYDIQFEFVDFYGNAIYGSFKGSLVYYNATVLQTAPKMIHRNKSFSKADIRTKR